MWSQWGSGVQFHWQIEQIELLACLGITAKKEQLVAQRAMAREAIRHLNIIVRQYRKLNGRRGTRRTGGGTVAEGRREHEGAHSPNKLNIVCNERVGVG